MGNPFDQFDQPTAGGNPFDRFDAPVKPKKPSPALDWSDVPLQAAKNVIPSAGHLVAGIWQAVRHPIDTAGSILDLGAGALRNTLPESVSSVIDKMDLGESAATNQKRISATADAAGKFVKDRYGSTDALKTTLANDPVGAALDLSTVLTGGGALAAKIPGLAKAGGVAKTAGNAINPINIARTAATQAGGAAMRTFIDQPKMAQRIADLKAGGIENPSLGLATGNSLISGVENLLSQTPGSVGLFDRARASNVGGMQAKAEGIRDAISTEYGPVVAGEAIQGDLRGSFRQRTKDTAKKLAERVATLVGGDTVVPVDNALAASKRLSSPIPGAEATSSEFINPRIAGIAENLRSDVYGPRPTQGRPLAGNPTEHLPLTPEVPQVPVNNSSLWNIPVEPTTPMAQLTNPPLRRQPVVMDSIMNVPKPTDPLPPLPQRGGPNPTLNLPMSAQVEQTPVFNASLLNVPTAPWEPMAQRAQSIGKQPIQNASLWNAQKEQGIPFSALKQLRTSIGDETASTAIMGTPEQAQFKKLYAAMSEDMRNAAGTADRARAGVSVGPLQVAEQPATVAMNRANKHFSTAMNRAEELDGLASRSTPEGAYSAVANSLKSGPTIYERLRSAVTPEARRKVAATVINDLGTASAGMQNAAGDAWSARTFLTNYNKLYRNGGGAAMFTRLPGGETYAKNLAEVAKASEMLGDGAKVWSNPSGTSQALIARGTIGTIGAGAVGGLFYTPLIAPAAVAGGSLILAHQVSQRLLLNPQFVSWLAKAPKVRAPAEMKAYAQALIVTAGMTNDPTFKRDVQDYLDSVGQ